jgi:hypothetical protein
VTSVSSGSGGRGVARLALRATLVCGGSSGPMHRGGEVVRWASHGKWRQTEQGTGSGNTPVGERQSGQSIEMILIEGLLMDLSK